MEGSDGVTSRNHSANTPTLPYSTSSEPPPPSRILIVKPSSLGDVIHAVPAVNLLRRRFPDAHLAWLVNESLTSLLRNCPMVDEVIPFPRDRFGRAAHWGEFRRFLRDLRRRQFDLVVDLQGLFRSGLIAWNTRAPRRLGLSDAREGARLFYTEVARVPRVHAVERCLGAARHLGCGDGPIEFPLGSSDADRRYVDELLADSGTVPAAELREPTVAISAAARWETKLWGDDKYAALLERLTAYPVVLIGSAADAERMDRIRRQRTGPRNLAGRTDLAQLTELLRRCAVLITNDSGPMHLAAAVGTPVVAVFGPTDPALTGPYGAPQVVLRSGVPCSPCLKPHCRHRPRLECMDLVTVDQVWEAAQAFLAGIRPVR